MIILVFLYSRWRLSLFFPPFPSSSTAVTYSRALGVNGENPNVLGILCSRQMHPCDTASEQGQMAINENKWLYVGREYILAGDEKKVPNHLKGETGAAFMQE